MNEETRNVAEEEDTIDLGLIIKVLWKKAWLIVLAFLIGAAIAFAYTTYLVVPQYESSAMIYVLTKTTSISSSFSLSLNQQLTTDFATIAKTRPVIEEAIESLDLNATYEQLKDTITVSNPSDTSMLKISVINPDPQLAADIANELSDIIAERIATVMVTDRPSSVEDAIPSDKPVSPSLVKNVAIGGLLGAFLVIGITIIMFLLDDTVKNPDDVRKRLNAPVLAAFPLEKQLNKKIS